MRKVILLIGLIFIITGCSGQESIAQNSYNLGDYLVLKPYKEAINENYTVYDYFSTNNVLEVETAVLDLSKKYYDPKKYYFEEGQLFSKEELISILNEVNNFKEIDISDTKVSPKLIISVYEANFYDKESILKGVSLGISVTPFLTYQSESGVYKNIDLSETEILKLIEPKIELILSYLYTKKEMIDKETVVGIFFTKKPNSFMPGSLKYYDTTNNSSIDLIKIRSLLTNLEAEYVLENDLDNYNSYLNFKTELANNIPSSYINSFAFYENDILNKISITINKKNIKYSELSYLSELASNYISSSASNDAMTTIYIKDGNDILCIIDRKKDDNEINIDFIERG